MTDSQLALLAANQIENNCCSHQSAVSSQQSDTVELASHYIPSTREQQLKSPLNSIFIFIPWTGDLAAGKEMCLNSLLDSSLCVSSSMTPPLDIFRVL